MRTKIQLKLEQTQHGVSDEVWYYRWWAQLVQDKLRFIATCSYSIDICKDIMKAQVTSTQDGKRSQDDDKRLYLANDLKEAQDHMQVKLKGTSSSLKSKDRYAYHKLKDKDSRPRAKTKDIHRMGRFLGIKKRLD
ncbi:hypothetical protein Tco_0457977 [Tanacetum coccineum]